VDTWYLEYHHGRQSKYAVNHLLGESAGQPARVVVEVEMMPPEYFAMSKQQNAWYKIARSKDAGAMMMDYMNGEMNDEHFAESVVKLIRDLPEEEEPQECQCGTD